MLSPWQVVLVLPSQGRVQAVPTLFPRHAVVQATQEPLCLPGILPPQTGGNTLEDPKHKWVIDLPSKPLTQAQRSLLAREPNYMVTPSHPSDLEYTTDMQSVCTKLSQQEVKEIRADINKVLRASHCLNPV